MNRSQGTTFSETLRQALALARTKPGEALDLLEEGLAIAREKGDQRAVSSLARNAGVLCSALPDLRRALSYYEEALSSDPDDAYLYFAVGDIHLVLGQRDTARSAFARSLELARQQGDVDMVAMASQASEDLDARDRRS